MAKDLGSITITSKQPSTTRKNKLSKKKRDAIKRKKIYVEKQQE